MEFVVVFIAQIIAAGLIVYTVGAVITWVQDGRTTSFLDHFIHYLDEWSN